MSTQTRANLLAQQNGWLIDYLRTPPYTTYSKEGRRSIRVYWTSRGSVHYISFYPGCWSGPKCRGKGDDLLAELVSEGDGD